MDMLSWIIIVYSAPCVEFHVTAHARLKTAVKSSLYISQTMYKISGPISRVQLQSTIHSREGIAGIQRDLADSEAHASTRGGHLSIWKLDCSASPFQNVFLLCEEKTSLDHHCHPGTFWQLEGATFLEQPQFDRLFWFACQCQMGNNNTSYATDFKIVGVSLLSHSWLAVLLPTLLI